MSGNLSELVQWDATVAKTSTGEAITETLLNQAAQALANRTQYLWARFSNFAADTGTANAYAIALSPAPSGHIAGLPLHFGAAHSNSGAATLAVNGMTPVAIVLTDGSAPCYGNIRAGGTYTVMYNGTAYVLLNPSERVGILRMEYTVPSGYIKRNGAEVSRTAYADLYAWAAANSLIVSEASWASGKWGLFGMGDGSTTFRIPDFRGEFERGLDDGRGVDSGRTLGSGETDAFRSHTHETGKQLYSFGLGGYYISPLIVGSGTATTSTGGTETRPRNIALIPIIKY